MTAFDPMATPTSVSYRAANIFARGRRASLRSDWFNGAACRPDVA